MISDEKAAVPRRTGCHPGISNLTLVPDACWQVLWGECISGALYVNDFLELARRVGFADPRQLHVRPM